MNRCISLSASVFRGSLAIILVVAITEFVNAQIPPTSQPTLATYSPPSHPEPLTSTFVDWDALAVRESAQAFSRAVFDNPAAGLEKLEMHITTLKPGMTLHAPHHHAWEEMCLVKEGEVRIYINGKTQIAKPGFLAFFASHDPHSIENVSDKPATYFVINMCTPAALRAPDKPAAEQAVPGKLPSSVFDCNNAAATANASGSVAKVFDSPTLTFPNLTSAVITLNAGKSGDAVDGSDELMFVRSGTVEVTINGIAGRLKEGSFCFSAPSDMRAVKNIGTTPAVYQVIRVTSK